MRPGPAAIAAPLLGLALILSACGGGGEATSAGGSAPATAPASRDGAAAARCGAPVRGLVASLDRLRDELEAGLSYDAYLGEVEAARAAYGGLPVRRLGLACLTLVGDPAERALNAYIAGVNAWGDCLARAGCEPTSVEAELKRRWAAASGQVSRAQGALRRLAPTRAGSG